jgi:hypothetical protein
MILITLPICVRNVRRIPDSNSVPFSWWNRTYNQEVDEGCVLYSLWLTLMTNTEQRSSITEGPQTTQRWSTLPAYRYAGLKYLTSSSCRISAGQSAQVILGFGSTIQQLNIILFALILERLV